MIISLCTYLGSLTCTLLVTCLSVVGTVPVCEFHVRPIHAAKILVQDLTDME